MKNKKKIAGRACYPADDKNVKKKSANVFIVWRNTDGKYYKNKIKK